MAKLTEYLGVKEPDLFIDHDAYVPREAISIQDGLTELFRAFPQLDHGGREAVLSTLRDQLSHIDSEPDADVKGSN